LVALALLASLCTAAGCGLSCGGEPEEQKAPSPVETAIELHSPSAAVYAGAEPLTPFDEKVVEAMQGLGPTGLIYDTCLSRAAEEYGRHIRPRKDGRDKPPRNLQEVVLHNAGCT